MANNLSADLIERIRNYQIEKKLLKKSHHFVFDCPLNFSRPCHPRYIWIGLNPGDDNSDWETTDQKNDEETRDRNFQEVYGRSRGSKTRMTKMRHFLGQEVFDQTTHTELFFWCSRNLQNDFEKRYGTQFSKSPHLEFCIEVNKELVNRIEPRAIFFESLDRISILQKSFSLEKINSYPAGDRRVDEYVMDGKFRLINFDHLSAGPPMSKHRQEVSRVVRALIGAAADNL
ncbi:hypothetical protein LIN78_03305 [Leeia sp. TBRC 13508]|uniref:LAGLIDADG homing endonuclease n=1 Tax=Leeia speluncae TaxID=2884804 RepID=A0ABS8D342_9NEIS|nr:hypothetical protein [Leeia speluncae]MCB6182577.1 hypothetical protein [Leeia speluncae]